MCKLKAQRRWNTHLKFKKAVMVIQLRWYSSDFTKQEKIKAATCVRDNLKDCSCSMCCNPRHNMWASNIEQLTLQERRNLDKFNDWKQTQI